MNADLMYERQQAHNLIDVLPIEKVAAVRNLMTVMAEPLSRSLALAEVEEEELSDHAIAALSRGDASLGAGEGTSHADLLMELHG